VGLNKIYLDYIEECIRIGIGELCGKKMLELGNQRMSDNNMPEKTGKEYFNNRGVIHTSVDLNGLDGALVIDLSKPLPVLWLKHFDIITNSGATEHVEPFKAQYTCFMNIHNCLKVGGIAVHLLPDINELNNKGCWKYHCNNYYSEDFVKMLAKNNSYRLISSKNIAGLICFCLQKEKDILFMKNHKEFLSHITRKNLRYMA